MNNLLNCPFCGGVPKLIDSNKILFLVRCQACGGGTKLFNDEKKAVEAWNNRPPTVTGFNVYDKEEIFPNCTVQVLTNTVTGAVSVGWWKNE